MVYSFSWLATNLFFWCIGRLFSSTPLGDRGGKVLFLSSSSLLVMAGVVDFSLGFGGSLGVSHGMLPPLLLLSLFLVIPTSLSSLQKGHGMLPPLLLLSLFLVIILIFQVEDLMSFFLLFELSLLPIMIIIFNSGMSKAKKEASAFLLAFTSSTAFFFLFFLLLGTQSGESLFLVSNEVLPFYIEAHALTFVIYTLALLTLLVKMPMLFLHMWLPKAHVEAPVYGSMVLASILLKLGGLGLILLSEVLNSAASLLPPTMLVLTMCCCWAGFACYGQSDIKVLIALSSVNHMTFVVLGILMGTSQALGGAMLLMLGHGLVSSCLFFMSMSSYSFSSTRGLLSSKAVKSNFMIILIWVFFIFLNSGFPPFLNFLGEVAIMKVALGTPTFILLLGANFISVGLYGVLMLSSLGAGKTPPLISMGIGGTAFKEWQILAIISMHLGGLLILNFTPSMWS